MTLYHNNKYCGFVVAQALCDFKTSTILVYMILNGKGSNWLWSTWTQSCFHYFFNCGVSRVCLFVHFVTSVYYSLAVEEKWRTTSSVSRLMESLLDI